MLIGDAPEIVRWYWAAVPPETTSHCSRELGTQRLSSVRGDGGLTFVLRSRSLQLAIPNIQHIPVRRAKASTPTTVFPFPWYESQNQRLGNYSVCSRTWGWYIYSVEDFRTPVRVSISCGDEYLTPEDRWMTVTSTVPMASWKWLVKLTSGDEKKVVGDVLADLRYLQVIGTIPINDIFLYMK